MPRTTVDDVRAELEAQGFQVDVIPDGQITTVGIDPAELEVDEDLAGENMSDGRLELIERYLAVDYLLSSDVDELRRTTSESEADGASWTFAEVPSYREKAKRLDKSGNLDSLDKPDAFVGTPAARGPTSNTRG